MSSDLPIVVDFERGLLTGDPLEDGLTQIAVRAPHRAAAIGVLFLRQGRAAALEAVARETGPQAGRWPCDAGLIEILKRERARGRAILLATRGDGGVAAAAAAELGLFDKIVASRDVADAVRRECPEGFVYAGHARQDDVLRASAKGMIGYGVGSEVAVTQARPRAQQFFVDLLRALRVHQWSKNLLIFVPLVLGHKFRDFAALEACAIAFVILSLTISGTYLVNDVADLASDRAHPAKRHRVIASGRMPASFGLILGLALVAGGMTAGLAVSLSFGALLSSYVALSLAYSVRLRQVALLDVVVIGALFTLRILMGIVVAEVPMSVWLLSFSMLLFTSLALAKRHAELMRLQNSERASIGGRGYLVSDWPLTLGFGLATGVASLQVMVIYLAQEAPGHYKTPAWLATAPAMVFVWLCRVWLLSHRGTLADDPVAFALRDVISLGLGAVVIVAFILAL